MKDKHGHIKYDDDPFTKKDKAFTERSWLKAHQETIQNVLREYHYVLDIFDDTLEIAQKKLYKGASADYLEYAAHWNQMAYEANTTLKEARSALLSEYKVLNRYERRHGFFRKRTRNRSGGSSFKDIQTEWLCSATLGTFFNAPNIF